ncbi:MAG: class II fumarate hydratase [Gammaproteobacteria bacterium]|nr:class II fumarate hydratase [Gammaproteobacteria bacterium]
MSHRIEQDSMGEVCVPVDALFGAQTQRALDNFGLTDRVLPREFIACLAQLKSAAAQANLDCEVLDDERAAAISDAAREVAAGQHEGQFPLSIFQTGSGTSSNMNMNEVLANIAASALGTGVHPNDHVNCSQSSNDVIPSAIQVTAMTLLVQALLPALNELIATISQRSQALHNTTKTGRTHLMDAMPLTFGQELSAWACQLQECEQRFTQAQERLRKLPMGGSAVGTGVNVPPGFAERLVAHLSSATGLAFEVAPNAFSRMAGQDVALECSACLRALAVVLTKINNDLRWMASGPLAGLAEIELEALQPGSSIMPGKVNPVLPEAVLMAAAEVAGNDASIAMAAQSGNFQLNVMLPLIAEKLCASFSVLTWGCLATAKTVAGFSVNTENIERTLARNPILVTALNSQLGYEAAAAIAKRAYAQKRPILDVAVEETALSREELQRLLDPIELAQGRPGAEH